MQEENKETHYEKSLWTVKVNTQTLYRKYIDGVTILKKSTPEETEKIAEIIDKAIASVNSALAPRESKREALAKSELDDASATQPRNSIWTFKINAQLLYKKNMGGRTVLFGMTEKEQEKTEGIIDSAINSLLEVLKDKTDFREAKEPPTPVSNMDPVAMATNTLQNDNGIEEEIEQAKKELEEAKKKAGKTNAEEEKISIEKADVTDEIKEATENKLREKVQEKKDKNSGSFWDNLK